MIAEEILELRKTLKTKLLEGLKALENIDITTEEFKITLDNILATNGIILQIDTPIIKSQQNENIETIEEEEILNADN